MASKSTENQVQFLSIRGFAYGLQHLLALFGSIVVTSSTCGLSMPVCLFTGGLGTLVFHLCTKGKVPVFTGASTAFVASIAATVMVTDAAGNTVRDVSKIPYVGGAIVLVGVLYALFALLAYFIGVERIKRWFPPIVVGPIIVIIGTKLAGKACTQASQNWIVAIVTLAVVLLVNCFGKGFHKSIPFLYGIVAGYVTSLIMDLCTGSSLVNFEALSAAPWIQPFWDFTSGEFFTLPKFDLNIILLITPVAFVTAMEHIGDITTNSAVVGQDFLKDPGLHRTLLGDGMSTLVAGLLGGNSTTTFSQNTGLLAITGIYDPVVLRIAAVLAMILALCGKVAGFVATIPTAVIGGISIVLFGSIASVGIRNMAENHVDFSQSRNIMIVAITLILGLGMSAGVKIGNVTISSLFIAVVVSLVLNAILPSSNAEESAEEAVAQK